MNNYNINNNYIDEELPLGCYMSRNIFYPFNPSLEEELVRLLMWPSQQYELQTNDCTQKNLPNIQQQQIIYENTPAQMPSLSPSNCQNQRGRLHCSFCKNNGERQLVYASHNLKTDYGIILCPVLRNYICPICNATGDNAHTIKYCPERNK